jgi:hypothetical protein
LVGDRGFIAGAGWSAGGRVRGVMTVKAAAVIGLVLVFGVLARRDAAAAEIHVSGGSN